MHDPAMKRLEASVSATCSTPVGEFKLRSEARPRHVSYHVQNVENKGAIVHKLINITICRKSISYRWLSYITKESRSPLVVAHCNWTLRLCPQSVNEKMAIHNFRKISSKDSAHLTHVPIINGLQWRCVT
jgi:hypothetical protein